MFMHVIAFTGVSGAGKTTAANILHESYRNLIATKMSFAEPLKALCKDIFPWVPAEAFFGNQAQRLAPVSGLPEGWTGRRILQHLGTEGFRAIDPDLWTKNMEHRLQHCSYPIVLIDDVRFPNEAALVRRYGVLYRINRPGAGIAGATQHESERHIPDLVVDGEIDNAGSLEDFERRIRAAICTAAPHGRRLPVPPPRRDDAGHLGE